MNNALHEIERSVENAILAIIGGIIGGHRCSRDVEAPRHSLKAFPNIRRHEATLRSKLIRRCIAGIEHIHIEMDVDLLHSCCPECLKRWGKRCCNSVCLEFGSRKVTHA